MLATAIFLLDKYYGVCSSIQEVNGKAFIPKKIVEINAGEQAYGFMRQLV